MKQLWLKIVGIVLFDNVFFLIIQPEYPNIPSKIFQPKYQNDDVQNLATVTTALIKWEFAYDNAHYFLLSHSMHWRLDIVAQDPSWSPGISLQVFFWTVFLFRDVVDFILLFISTGSARYLLIVSNNIWYLCRSHSSFTFAAALFISTRAMPLPAVIFQDKWQEEEDMIVIMVKVYAIYTYTLIDWHISSS